MGGTRRAVLPPHSRRNSVVRDRLQPAHPGTTERPNRRGQNPLRGVHGLPPWAAGDEVSDRTGETAEHRMPLVTVACHEDLTASDLVGRYLLDVDGTRWVDGPLTRAVKVGAICYL